MYSKYVYFKRFCGFKGYFIKINFFIINFYDIDIKRFYINKSVFVYFYNKLIGKVKYSIYKKYRVNVVK